MKCRATSSRTGKPCRNHAIHGATVCAFHGGSAPQVRRRAAERVARARAGAHLAAEGIVLEDLDPLDPLLVLGEHLALSYAVSERVRELVTSLDAIHVGDNELHVLVRLWNEERDRTARIAKLAVDLGVPERPLQLAEETARLVARVVEDTFADSMLDLTEAQKALGRKVIARHLRAVDEPPS